MRGVGYFASGRILSHGDPKKALVLCSFCNMFYIASYLIPVACETDSDKFCNKLFSGILLMVTGAMGGFVQALAWIAKKEYIRRQENQEDTNRDLFLGLIGVSGIISAILSIILVENTLIRAGLYMIFTLLIVNALFIQICIFL